MARPRKSKWYDYTEIDKKKAQYNLIVGERSNGKTYGAIKKAFTNYIENGKHTVMIRRFDEQLTPKNIGDMWTSFIQNGEVEKISDGEYNSIIYYRRKWYCAYYDDNENEYTKKDKTPFMHALSLNTMENTKSGFSDPDVTMIIFDEFLTREYYLKNEFILFQNLLSTVIRSRDDVKIYMLANTVNFSAPYFREMGISNILKQEQGTIDVYSYNDADGKDTGLRVAVEYCASKKKTTGKGKKSDVYFAFNNPQINMIVSGTWEMASYPHPDWRVSNSAMIWNKSFLEYEDALLQLELYIDEIHGCFVVVHPFTSELLLQDTTQVYTLEYHGEKQYKHGMDRGCPVNSKIWELYHANKWVYADNTTGEIVNNFVKSC